MDNYSKAELEKKIIKLAQRGVLKDKRIVLFGASVFSKEIKNCLLEHGYSIAGVVDNDRRKVGTQCMALEVQRPEAALLPYKGDTVVLMLSSGFYREMAYQLLQMGYSKKRDFFVLNFKTNESLSVMAYIFARAMRGLFTYKKLVKGMGQKRAVFLAPYTGTGDIYLVGLFFNEFLRKNAIDDYVFVVVSGACRKVAEMFDIKNIMVIRPRVTDDIINAYHFLRVDWPLFVLNDGWLRELTQWIRGYKGLDFEKMFRYFVFGFDDSVAHALPPAKDHGAQVDELFEKYGLIKHITVVLSPYSNTLFDLPDAFWERIVRRCEELGYTVCTNCAGKAEKPIAGTKPVFFPLGIAEAFMDAAGFFVGVRSGLCDVISKSSCKKIVLYEKDGFFYRCSPFEYFSLERMGLCTGAIELEYRNDVGDAVLNIIEKELETNMEESETI